MNARITESLEVPQYFDDKESIIDDGIGSINSEPQGFVRGDNDSDVEVNIEEESHVI